HTRWPRDWSSDVCSSDLMPSVAAARLPESTSTVFIGVVTLLAAAGAAIVTGVRVDSGNLAAATLGMIPLGLLVAAIGYLAAGWQIGRASCREGGEVVVVE